MTGVVLLLVLAIGAVSLLVVVNAIDISNEQHERSGLFGDGPRARRLEVEALDALVAADESMANRTTLAQMVEAFDRLAFAGTPLIDTSPTREWGWWTLRFADGTELRVQVGDPRTMSKVRNLATKETIVVARVHPHVDSAVVELVSPRHRPLRVALRS
jgi:hypothetical protein